MTPRRMLSLLELDPDLGQFLPEERRVDAQTQLQVEVHRLPEGPWSGARLTDTNPEHVGLLLLEGVVSREVVVSDTVSTELLGPGDVLRPWAVHDAPALLQSTVRWNALTESRVAVLDRRFASRLTHWPEVNSVLIDRLNERAQRLATTQAVSQLNRVDRRLISLFWHLAERWGRMTPDGVLVPLTLSHRMLGQLVGARRPTVSTAISELAKRDELVRRADGTWLLKGDPIGLPTEEAQRIIPIRRKLLGREPEPEALPEETVGGDGAHAPLAEEHSAVILSAGAELRATMARLREETRERLDDLRHSADASRELAERITADRERRAEQRDLRGGS